MTKCTSIHWFRKGLRIHDNPALIEACKSVQPIFILDPWFQKEANVGINRWRFLLQTLKNLDENLKQLNSRLFVIRGKPLEVLPTLFKKWNVKKLTFEVDTEPYAKQRDAEVEALAKRNGVEVVKCVSHTLYDTNKTIAKNGGKPPLTYQRMQTLVSQMGPPPKPAETLQALNTYVEENHDTEYGVPSLEELGFDEKECGPNKFPGGETEALKRMENMLKKTNWICNFEKPKTEPNSLEPSTTVLSPYLKFGCLSARTFYHRIKQVQSQNKKHSAPPVSLDGQMLWREFFYTVGAATPNFDQMEGNPVCTQIPWEENLEHLEAWKMGKTGFPFIDALMTQLRQEGWIHHLGRHAVACFLTRGDLWISWEEGEKVFEEYLLDADWSLNAGNWMWLSASSFFYQYFRVYSPIEFGKKTDKDGSYIRKYIPALKNFPTQYIYEPWKAPLKAQEKAGCIIGRDYPKPIVDHSEVRQRNISRMAEAYKKHKESKAGAASSKPVKAQKRKLDSDENPSPKKKSTSNKKMTDYITTTKE